MSQIVDHPSSSVLSALGMGLAQPGRVVTQGILPNDNLQAQLDRLRDTTIDRFRKDFRFAFDSPVEIGETVAARYVGNESTLPMDANPIETIAARFHVEHQRVFGYQKLTATVEVVSAETEVCRPASFDAAQVVSLDQRPSSSPTTSRMFASGCWHTVDVWDRDSIGTDRSVDGPALIVSDFSTLVVEPGWTARMSADGLIRMARLKPSTDVSIQRSVADQQDIADVEIYARRLQGIADSMGEVLRRTAISVNVKQRRDYSCAVFASDGALLAGALHVPVHLGAMSQTVREMIQRFPNLSRGDALVTNDPFAGGSHLPDVTVVQPVFSDAVTTDDCGRVLFFVASRAHHAEIGGMTPGSMPPFATNLAQEGVLIRPMKLIDGGIDRFDDVARILTNAEYPTRRLNENLADLRAQVAAGVRGASDLRGLADRVGHSSLDGLSRRWLDVAGDAVSTWIDSLPMTRTTASDQLDDGTTIAVRMQRQGRRLQIELESNGLHPHGFNAPTSISVAAVLYVLRCFCSSRLPLCDGVMRDVDLKVSPGLLSPTITGDDPNHWPAVVAGNVETSNRVVDVLIQAISNWPSHSSANRRVVAASGGTMNNTIFGDDTFGYYETMGVGSGATDKGDGESAVQTHMTNTRITDVEILESRLPIRLHRFAIRLGTGGIGVHRGGDGLVREFEFLTDVSVSLLTNRRTTSPPGADGGGDAAPGRNTRVDFDGQRYVLPPCAGYTAKSGERLVIETPGGGGVGRIGG
jgi:5-oxoprolinase (ATP-hydrolysing)